MPAAAGSFIPRPETEWSVDGLAGGSYYAEVVPSFGDFFVRRLHNGIPCPFPLCEPASGPPLTVPVGGSRSDVVIDLTPGGVVSGTLVDADTGLAPGAVMGKTPIIGDYLLLDEDDVVVGVRRGSNLRGRIVDENSGEGIAEAVAVLVHANNRRYAAVRTNALGDFTFGGFPAGTYYLRTAMSTTFGQNRFPDRHAYFDRVYGASEACSEQLCDPNQGTALAVHGVTDIEGLMLSVPAGPVIRGFVRDPLTRASIGRGAVEVYDSENRLVGSYVISGLDFQYQTTALVPGSYRLVAVLSEAFAPLIIPPQAPRSRSSLRAVAQAGEQFITVEEGDLRVDFLAVDRAIDRILKDRFQVP